MWSRQDRYGTDERFGSNPARREESSKNSLARYGTNGTESEQLQKPEATPLNAKLSTAGRAAIAKAAKKRWWR
jgi:hypothetical protein